MADLNNEVKIGISVEILRSDGRIHSALISSIQDNSVTVEWYEAGEAKGKEIDFDSLLRINPDLQLPNLNGNSPDNVPSALPQQQPPPASVIPSNQVNKIRAPNAPSAASGVVSAIPPPRTNNNLQQQSHHSPGPTPNTGRVLPNNEPKRPPQQQQYQPPAAAAPPPSSATLPSVVPQTNNNVPPVNKAVAQQIQQQRDEPDDFDDNYDDDIGGGDMYAANADAGAARKIPVRVPVKSNVVKEIERIQQRREERRAAQQKMRDVPEYDPTNPNNEFLMMIKNFQNTLDFRPISSSDPVNNYRICVCVRKRPLNKKELARKEIDVITIPNKDVIYVSEPKLKVDLTKYLDNQQFRYDYSFDEHVDNAMVYRYTAKPLVESVFEGAMATCFAYGQTGSGKTHTMGGEFQAKGTQDCSNGIYALAASDMFQLLKTKYFREDLFIEASFFEIYSGKVFDLLNKKQKLRVLEDGNAQVQIVGLKEELVTSVEDVKRLLQHGNNIRTSGQTSANVHSSRSHAVFQLKLKKRQNRRLHGKFSLIDLAGNERGADTSSSDRTTRMEGAEINKSLLSLKECIRALGRKGAHLPFRGSTLTLVLRDSFIGDKSRTCMISMISPGMSSCEHTLNTLRYADRVKELEPGQGGNNGSANNRPATALKELEDVNEDEAAILGSDELMTDEYITFQAKMDHIERMEEDVCDRHQTLLENLERWSREHRRLVSLSNEPGYDIADFSVRLENLLQDGIKEFSTLRDKVSAWRCEMLEEEAFSSKILNETKK